ncbi:MAG: DNA repair protein RecN [bacterium]|nr:DNA repair protein RecN [bacterium]
MAGTMLETLHIKNYALIDEAEFDFGPGFNVLTGETGAGKSIIVGALNLVLGARASGDAVRDGADRARVDAVFRIERPSRRLNALLKQRDIDTEDGELHLSRTVSAEGRSRAYAGGTLVPVSVLAEIGDELVDLHGQHEHQSLLKVDRQLGLLDAYAGTEDDAADVARLVGELRRVENALAELETDDRERARRMEFLRFEVSEIDSAQLETGEEETVRSRRNRITNAETIVECASHAYACLFENEETAACESVAAALADLEQLAEVDESLKVLAERLESIRSDLEDVSKEVRAFTDDADFDPAELETLNQRLAAIAGLKRKYGDSIEEILAYRERGAAELEQYDQRDKRLEDMRHKRDMCLEHATAAAKRLSAKRKTASRRLDKRVTSALQDLGMKGGTFETALTQVALSNDGVDRVAFLLCANPGEKLKPLRQVASGGEISRVMLAIKTVFAGADCIPTLIFDEIDSGVGGAVAKRVAARLDELARSHQTICITHIAQIASVAATHYQVLKASNKSRTQTRVARVSEEARVEELARLLDGSVSDVSLDHARALLNRS